MSQKSVEAVIGKVVMDIEFRKALATDADKALAAFDLTEAEKASLKSMDAETMDALAHTLESRVSKIFHRGW